MMKGRTGEKKEKKEKTELTENFIKSFFSKERFCTADHKDHHQPQNEKQLPRGPFARASKVVWFSERRLGEGKRLIDG